ncbi:cytochrome P450 [Nocardioides sp.]|uniref:cytochrome P450 n=1 Tax=Nocardioides sp. TaxID=35761 RepID=UPI003513FC3F
MSTTLPALRRRDRGLPVFGKLFSYLKDPVALMQHHWDTYGAVSPFPSLAGRHAVLLLGPEACEAALVNRDKAFVNGPAWSRIIGPFFHDGLMLLDFEEHHQHRRIMQGAFTRDRLAGYVDLLHPALDAGLADWRPADAFPAYPRLKQLTLDIAAHIFMGGAEDTSPAEMDRLNAAFIDCVQAAAGVVRADVPFTRWGRAYRGRRELETWIRHYVPKRRAEPREDLLSALCHLDDEGGTGFSDDAIVDHMIFLMMAAHDTSTITVSTMLQHLGQHPEWQERCRAEALALGPTPSLAELESMTDTALVMKEALRLVAPVTVLMRRTVADTEVCGVAIPADTDVIVGVQFSHVMPRYWRDPERFDPERFAEPRREDKGHRLVWQPFGGGVHKCLGLHFAGAEVHAILHRMLREFTWQVSPDYRAPLDFHSLPYPTDGQPIRLRHR